MILSSRLSLDSQCNGSKIRRKDFIRAKRASNVLECPEFIMRLRGAVIYQAFSCVPFWTNHKYTS